MWLKIKTILIFPKCKELSHFNKMCDVALHDIKYDPRGLFLENSLNFNSSNNYYYQVLFTSPHQEVSNPCLCRTLLNPIKTTKKYYTL